MFRKFAVVVIAILAFAAICNVLCQAQALPALTHHVREVTLTGEAPLVGQLPADQSLLFDVMLPLRDRAGLQSLIQELYDPTSASYHKFITPEEVTERFGPSQGDWDTLVAFAMASGFDVLGGTRDSRDLWLRGTVADIQKAFHVTMNVYQDTTEEGRTFFAVDREPTTNLPFPLWHITGLDNDSKPHPLYVKKGDYAKAHGVSPESIVSNITGSGPSNNFLGSDMRAAYYQGTALTGSGQNIGLFELAGTDLADLTTYYTNVKQTEPYTPTLVSTGGYATTCTYSGGRSKECDDTEQTIDLTQAMGMAPGSTMLYMYVCGNVLASGSGNFSDSACISAMVTTTAAPLSKQISCSWGWTPADNTTLDPYFEQMASQGQNFFAASGDSSTWSSSNEAWPADDVNVVTVGGTDLTTSSAGGPWSSETAWSDSGGGISPDKFAIPTWQQISGVINSSNKGSTTYRNGPDVSANGNFSFYYCADQEGCGTGLGGTSFAAPMWAGYLALANQQAAANGELIGFINPTIYEQAALGGTTYSTLFHDITSGTSGSYSAETGYDLVTGWGSPNTTGLINLLAPASSLATTTALSSTLNPSAYGQAVTFTAKVTASSGTPTGTVQFSIDGSSFGSPVTLVSGSATSGSTSTLTEGTHTVTAAYSGATGFLTSNGTLSGGQVVNAATAATVVTSTVNPSVYGQPVTLTATISGQYGLLKGGQHGEAVTGTVAWSANTGCGTTNVTSGTPGLATCTTSSLAVGTDVITATYSGDGNHSGSTGTLSGGQVVNAATSATTVASTLNPSAYGQAVSFSANVAAIAPGAGTPTGTVQFSIDGSSVGSPVALVSGSATSSSISTLAEGTHTITAAYSGSTNFLTSNGTLSGGQTVNAATASTVVTSTVNPSVYGQSVTLTATISGQYGLLKAGQRGQAVTGTVAWSANTGCGTTNVVSGVASCMTSSLAVGTDVITATYSGDGNHSGSTGTLSGGQLVNPATSATTVASTLNPSAYGQAVSFTANVAAIAPGAGTPTGTVQFSIDGSSFGSPVTLASGSATSSSISTLAEGTHTVTAAYSGSTNFLTSNGMLTGGQTVNAATAATVVTSTVNPSVYGQQVTLTATISGQYGLLKKRSGARGQDVTGTVTWSANTGCGTTSVTSGNPGVAICTTSSLIVGNNAITATYSGDGNHGGGAGTLSGGQTVNPAITSIAVTGVSPSNEDYGLDSPVTLTAQLSWTGSGTAPTAGNVTIGGNGPSSYGATSCGPVSGNTITCTNTYTPTVADAAGGYTETAAFSADSNYSASSSPQTNNFTINSATSSTVVTSGLSPSTYGQSVTFTATISGENGLTKGRTRNSRVKPQDVTGTVAWSANTGCGTTSVTAGNPGAATCTTSSLAGGGDSVVASYSGDVNHGTSSGTFSQTVNPASQAITFNTNAPASATYNTNFTVAATGGASGNPVTFTSSGSCSNSGATYTMTSGTGSCSVIANQTGNGNYSAAPPATETVSAAKASQTVNFTTNAPASANNGSSFTVAASATSSLAVSYTSAGVCSNVGATYTMTSGSGTCSVIASQTGNDNYAAASPVTEMVNATGLLPQTITFTTPAPNTAKSGDSFTVAAVGGASGNPVTFSAGAGSVCALSGATYTMTSNTGFCYVVANQAGNGTYAAAPQVTETVTAVKTVVKVAPTVTFTGAPSSASYLSTFTVATTQNSGVSPTVTSTTGSVCTVSGNVVTMKNGTGTCTVKASWAANDYYLAATLEQSTAATQLATTTAITNTIPEKNPLKVTVYFTASNGTSTATAGTVQVTAASGQSCSGTVSSGKCVLTFPSAESTTVTASYEGNTDNAGSSSAPYPLTVN
jgi:kumamolisin